MLIEESSIRDHSDAFFDFSLSLGTYAVVALLTYAFRFQGGPDEAFSQADLRKIFSDPSKEPCVPGCPHSSSNPNCIYGILEFVGWGKAATEEALEEISLYLSIEDFAGEGVPDFQDYVLLPDDEAGARLECFYAEVEKHFAFPATRVYRFRAGGNAFLSGWIFWEFCYIFLNDHDGRGIVLVGQSYD